MKHTENSAEPFSLIKTTGDLGLAIARGKVKDVSGVNKYGLAIDGVQQTATDIWDLGNAAATQQIWLAPTAARVHTLVSTSANDVSGIGTLTLTGQPADTNTCTIGTKVYTFQTVLTDVDGNVLIGASASATIDNLIAAINLEAGAGTTYATLTTAGAESVMAYVGAGDTMSLYDNTSSAIATTETMDNATWGAANTVNGTGAVGVQVCSMADWDTEEVWIDYPMHGVDGVTLPASVIIHRMKVIAVGANYGINAGTITATAASDATITANIVIGAGQTNMAIYGIPSTHTAYMKQLRVNCHDRANPATPVEVDFVLLINERPDLDSTVFILKGNTGVITSGSSNIPEVYDPPLAIPGPAIIKIQGVASADDTEGAARFDMTLFKN